MIAVDTNVLLYAYRTGFPLHLQALDRIAGLAQGEEPWALPVWSIVEFVRVATHDRVLNPPAPLDHALDHVGRLLESPSAVLLLPGAAFWSMFAQTCRDARAQGNLVFDAAIAALCREWGISDILTEDRDFARFPGLRIVRLEKPLP